MSNSKLKTRIKNLTKNDLSNYGFTIVQPRIIERKLEHFIQGVEFQPGIGHLSGKYTLNIYWRFDYMPEDYISFDGNYRIGELLGKGDIWFSRENEQLEIDFDIVKELFKNTIIPFFDKYSSLETLISNYESGNISKRNAFGASICWQHFNAGFSYAILNRNEKAIYELNTLIHKYSNDELDWVKKRKSYAQKKLDELLGI